MGSSPIVTHRSSLHCFGPGNLLGLKYTVVPHTHTHTHTHTTHTHNTMDYEMSQSSATPPVIHFETASFVFRPAVKM
jgi:hypothetical protein